MDPLDALKARRQAALTKRADPLDELKRRKAMTEDTALSPLLEDQPFTPSRPPLPAGPRQSQPLPPVVTTAPAPGRAAQALARAIAKETKASAPWGREEDLIPEQRKQLERARYARAAAEDIGKAFVGQPVRTVYRTAAGIAALRGDPRAEALSASLRRVEEETTPETGLGIVPRLAAEIGAFAPGGLMLGAARSGIESAAGEESSTASQISRMLGRGGIDNPRLRAVADAGIDLTIPGVIAAVKAAKSLKEAINVGDDLAKAFARGAQEGAAESAESVVGSFARKDGYRQRQAPEARGERLLPSRSIPSWARPLQSTGLPQGPAIPMPAGQVRPEGPASSLMKLLAPRSEAMRQRLFWMPAAAEQTPPAAATTAPAVRRRTAAEALERRPAFEQAMPEGATPEEISAYVKRKARFVGRPRIPIEEAMERADELVADRVLRTEAFGTPAQRRERLARAGVLLRPETARGPKMPSLPEDALLQAFRETSGEVPRIQGGEVPGFLQDVPIDEVIKEIDRLSAPPKKKVPLRKLSDAELEQEITSRNAALAEAQSLIAVWDERIGGVTEQFTSQKRSPYLTAQMRAKRTRETQARNPVTGEILETAAERNARERGISDENLSRLEEAGFVDRDDFFAQKKELDKLRFSLNRLERSRDAAQTELARRTEATTQGRKRGGFVSPGITGAVGGFGAGFTAGLATDESDDSMTPLQRALAYGAAGAAVGAGAFTGAARLGRTQRVAPSIPELAPVSETINVGKRQVGQAERGLLTPLQKLYNDVVSETFVLEKTAERYGGGAEKRREIQGAIAKQQGAQQSAKQYLLTTLSPVLQSLDSAEQESLRSLLKARRDLQIRERGGAAKSAVSTVDLDAAVRAGNANQKIASAADAITQAHRDLLAMRREAGLLTDEAYQAIVASDDFYTPLYRELAQDPAIAKSLPGARTGKFGVSGTGVSRMDRTIEALENTADPLEMLAADAVRTYRDVGKQRVANIIFDLADTAPGNIPFIRRIQADPTRPPRRDNVIQQIRNGKLYTYEVSDPDIFKALAGQDNTSSRAIVRVAQTMKNLKTSGIVVLPDFAASNVIRDVAMSGLQRPDLARAARESAFGAALGGTLGAATTEGDESTVRRFLAGAGLGAGVSLYARPFIETMGAVKAIVGNEQAYREFLANGASTEGFYIKNANDAAKIVKDLAKGPGFSLDDIIIPTNWWETLRKIGSVGEQATRLAAYRQVLEAGGQVDDAVRAAQDRTLRFANIGASRTVKSFASMTPFWNAKVQGWDKLARMMRDPKTAVLGAAMLTGPSIALWSINKDNPEYWERPTYEKNLFWLVPKSAVHGDDRTGFYRIPKPFELGFMFASMPERALDYATQKGIDLPLIGQIQSATPQTADPSRALTRSAVDIAAATFEGTIPVPEIVSLPGQLIANRDLFRNRPIVTRPNLPEELQATKESSAIARALSRAGISPEKTDFAIRGLFGTAGAEASKAIDIAARAAGVAAPEVPEGGASVPLLGRFAERFTTSNRGQSEPEALARDQIRELSRIEAGFRELKRLGNQADILDYAKRNRAELLLADNIQPLERELDKLASLRTKITKDPTLTAEQKRQALEVLRTRGANISRQMLAVPLPEEEQE